MSILTAIQEFLSTWWSPLVIGLVVAFFIFAAQDPDPRGRSFMSDE